MGSSRRGCQWGRIFDYARQGNALRVVRLDRLGRSWRGLPETIDQRTSRGLGLVSLEQ